MKRFKRLIIAVAIGLGLPALSAAAENPTPVSLETLESRIVQGPSLSDLVAYGYLQSPMIAAAREQWKGSVEQYRVDTAHENPELMVEGMYMDVPFTASAAPDDWKVGISQSLPLPGRLGKAGEVSESEAGISRLKLDVAVRDVTASLRESYQELLYLGEARRIAGLNRELLDQLVKAGETAYTGDKTALVDVLKAQAQSGQLMYDALLLQELESTEKTRINSLLSRAPDAPIGPLTDEPPRPVVYRVEEIYPLAEANYEEIKIAGAGERKASAMLEFTRYMNLPEFKVGLSYGEEDNEKQYGIEAGFMLPLWPGKNAGRLGAARADLEKMRAMKTSQVNETRVMVRDNWFRLQNSERLIKLYRDDLLPQAAKAMETAELRFRQGQGSFSDYVEVQSAFYNFQLALARAKADYGKFLSRLETLAGTSLTNRGISEPSGDAKEGAK
jgi:outer membrane protein TolC